ncbi:MAG: short-chain fatty acid transporter [Deltaproteobacteria bacterium]|nr:short-chain fatty acid transporter [Deltaproteobacteria bacterium]
MTAASNEPNANGAAALDRFASLISRYVPDAITACAVLLLVLFGAALALGNTPAEVGDAYYTGLWSLLPFTMQMTLIIVLSATLATTPFFRSAISALARLPRTTAQVVALSVLITASVSYFYWGLGIVLSPIIAVSFAREAERRGIAVDFLFLLATIWGSHAVWQYGLSSSAPLIVATPGHPLEASIGVLPLATTIGSPAAIAHVCAYMLACIGAGVFFMPKQPRPVSQFPGTAKLGEPVVGDGDDAGRSFAERLERTSFASVVFIAALAAWLWLHLTAKGGGLDFNSLNAVLLLLCLAFHRNVSRFSRALERAVTTGWPVIVLYHLYAGVAGLIQHTTLGAEMAGFVAGVSTPLTFPLLTAASGTLFSLFIPSSGGQWAIQGFVTSQAASEVGVSVQRGLLALGVGDHMGNLMSPFWYLVVAGIAGVSFRSFYGYGLAYAALWFVMGTAAFTFLPC